MRKRQDPTVPATEPAENFLSRWSRRKRQARSLLDETAEAQELAVPFESSSTADFEPAEPATQTPVTDADLPPLETLDENSDYSGFLSPGVSDALRQRALRKLFASSKFQYRDGLDDYDEDYNKFEPLGGTVTADMRHRMQVEAERLARAEGADEGAVESDAEVEPQSVAMAETQDVDGAGTDQAEAAVAEVTDHHRPENS